jgi:hypothetical protein
VTFRVVIPTAVAAWPLIAVGAALVVCAALATGLRWVRLRARASHVGYRQEAPPALPPVPPGRALDDAREVAEREPPADGAPDLALREALGLALRHGLPFTGLRDFELNPRLFSYLPTGIALAERTVPLLLVDDHLKVASATPHPDLRVVRERFPFLTIDVLVAPADEVELVLAHALGA